MIHFRAHLDIPHFLPDGAASRARSQVVQRPRVEVDHTTAAGTSSPRRNPSAASSDVAAPKGSLQVARRRQAARREPDARRAWPAVYEGANRRPIIEADLLELPLPPSRLALRLLLPLFQSTSLAQSRQTAFKPIRCVWFAIAGAAAGTPAATAFIAATVGGITIGAATVTGSTGREFAQSLGGSRDGAAFFVPATARHTTAAPLRRVPSRWSQRQVAAFTCRRA